MSLFWTLLKGKWNPPQDTQPSFNGRTVLITGANTGVGFEAAVKFVSLGAKKVILGVRTLSKGEEAKRQIEERTGRTDVVEVWHIDMLDYTTVKAFSNRVNSELEKLDIAVLNAGVVKIKYQQSQYGFEETMQVHVLSTTLLSLLLMPKLKASGRKDEKCTPVLEIVGSSNHFLVNDVLSEETPFAAYNSPGGFTSGGVQYAVSKLFVMHAQTALVALASSPEDSKPEVHVTVVCPGATQSNLEREVTQWYLQPLLWLFRVLFQRQTEEGARTYISGVCQGEKLHGKFWKDDTIREPAPLMTGDKAEILQERVWDEIVEALRKDVPEIDQLI